MFFVQLMFRVSKIDEEFTIFTPYLNLSVYMEITEFDDKHSSVIKIYSYIGRLSFFLYRSVGDMLYTS